MQIEIIRSLSELKERFPDKLIVEEDKYYTVFLEENIVKKFLKPRTDSSIKEILSKNFFPKHIVEEILVQKKFFETQALKIAKKYGEGLFLEGGAGIGKTFACIYAISDLVRMYKVSAPLYVSCITYRKVVWDLYPDADCYLIDDLNMNLEPFELKLVEKIVYTAWNERRYLFITSNTALEKLRKILPEPIMSRIFSLCQYAKIEDKDWRIEKK
jgi:DNA replication protein DnaC